jgi:hypothetical protein
MAVARSSNAMHPALYRSYQFFVAVKASLPVWAGGRVHTLSLEDTELVQTYLPQPQQQALLGAMPPNDQRHAVAVARTLKSAGHTHLALMQAALLHDVGKSMGQPILYRVMIVLFEAFWPAALERLGHVNAPANGVLIEAEINKISWWRRPFVIHARHPQLGADWATEAGCLELASQLILYHQEKPAEQFTTEEAQLLAALQWADSLN